MNVLWVMAFACTAAVGLAQPNEGEREWRFALGTNSFTGSSAASASDGRTIFIGVETNTGRGRVLAISRDGGNLPIWSRDLPKFIYLSSPALSRDERTLYIGCQDGNLYALNTSDGSEKWHFKAGTFVTSSPAIGVDGTIYFGGEDSKLHALIDEVNRAVERWPPFLADSAIESSPAVAPDGTIYFGSSKGTVHAVTSLGEKKWTFETGGEVISSPAIGTDGTIYIGSTDQKLYALAPDGTKKWDFFTNDKIESSPTLGADGTVYIASFDRFLYAFNPAGGDENRVKWKAELSATASSSAAVRGDGVIIIAVDGSRVLAFEPDGRPRWTFDAGTDQLAEASPLVAPDGSIYVGFFDGFLYKLRGNGSPLSSYSSWPGFRRDAQHSGRALTVTGGGQLANLSIRAQLGGSEPLIVGFVVQSASGHVYLVRGIGPTLGLFNVNGMPDPRLDVFAGGPLPFRGNDDWETGIGFGLADVADRVGAFALPASSKDAAIADVFSAGVYSAHVNSTDGRGGVALVEIYDTPVPEGDAARLVNLSTRGQVGIGENALIAGVVVGGTQPTRLLVRGVGPGLSQFGLSGVLARPTISLFQRQGDQQVALRSNRGWTSGGFKYDFEVAAKAVAAFPLVSGPLEDAAMIVTLAPEAYTIQLSGVDGATGEGLIEIYVLP
jgi:outer membrane protein assembly factor BamB